MVELAAAIERYFAERNIPTYGLTVILNFQDFQSAAKLDAAVNREFCEMVMNGGPDLDLTNFKVRGINMKIESPVHVRLV